MGCGEGGSHPNGCHPNQKLTGGGQPLSGVFSTEAPPKIGRDLGRCPPDDLMWSNIRESNRVVWGGYPQNGGSVPFSGDTYGEVNFTIPRD